MLALVYGTRPLRGARLAASGVAAAADFGEWSGEQCRGLENTRTNWVVGTSKVPIYEKSAVSQWVQIGEGPRYKGRAWYQGGPGHQRGAWVSACAMCVCVCACMWVSLCVCACTCECACVCVSCGLAQGHFGSQFEAISSSLSSCDVSSLSSCDVGT